MKIRFVNIIILLIIFFPCEKSHASWLIDGNEYHSSAHGLFSCAECHSDIKEDSNHPSTGNINKPLDAFFNSKPCIECHDGVLESIESEEHGNLEEIKNISSDSCINCHNPHYQKPYSNTNKTKSVNEEGTKNYSDSHENRTQLPELSAEDRGCLECHFVNNGDARENLKRLCAHCHSAGSGKISKKVEKAVVDFNYSGASPHSEISCLDCHKDSAKFGHSNQKRTDCLDCHIRHHEKVTHDVHMNLSCESCHLHNVIPVREIKGSRMIWSNDPELEGEYDPHRMILRKEDMCARCHFDNNNLGASDHVLPAKSIICMPCHAATFSVGDIPSIAAIIIFLIGLSSILLTWLFAGKRDEKRDRNIFANLINIVKALILDGFLQRRLFKVSLIRWIIHSMIFFPFIIRFLWGITALILSLYNPEWDSTWLMLSKNNPFTGFLFDLTGALILVGGCLMVLERKASKIRNNIQALPESKPFIHILLGGIIITGFILEGARIAMTGIPEGSEFAFIGYGISRLLIDLDITGIYIYLWYIHAVLTGTFIACLPFSRMFHILIAPLSVVLKAVSKE